MLCADLDIAPTYSGSFSQLAFYTGTGYSGATGTAELTILSSGMYSKIMIAGGNGMSGQTFNAHLHASSCSVNGGGGHYQNPDNLGVVDAVSENWPTLRCDASGNCAGGAMSNCGAR